MKLQSTLLAVISFASAALLPASEPLYSVSLASGPSFELVAETNTGDRLNFYPLSRPGARIGQGIRPRKMTAAGYNAAAVTIKTTNPTLAAQDILSQVSRQTGLILVKHVDSALEAIAPITMVQAFSETAVITLLLTPKVPGVYLVTCAYVIDERPEGSIDGTPASIAKMAESRRLISADSTATQLPDKIALGEIKPGEYFRSPLQFNQPAANGGFYLVAVLMLKKGNDYTLGFYRNEDGILTLLDQPVTWSGTKSPYVTNLPNPATASAANPPLATQIRTGFRADNIDGLGGYYLSLEDDRTVKTKF